EDYLRSGQGAVRNAEAIGQRFDRDAELLQSPEVRTHRAESQGAAARLWDVEGIEMMEQRTDEHEDGARARRRFLVDCSKVDDFRWRNDEVAVLPSNGRTDGLQHFDEAVHFLYLRNLAERGRTLGKKGGGKEGDGAVLGAVRNDFACERL